MESRVGVDKQRIHSGQKPPVVVVVVKKDKLNWKERPERGGGWGVAEGLTAGLA